ncbi:CDP-alcohol phosphatidyltransferase family protein [Nocardioides korecus]
MAPQDAAPRTTAVWTVPNLISMARLAGVPLFLWLVIGPKADVWALVVLMVAGFSDWLDGYLARRLDQTSRLGEILDPVADRLYILAAVVGLLYRDIIPWWVAIALPLRDAFLWCLVPFLRTRGYSALPVHYLGKAATAALLYAFPLLFLGDGDGTTATVARVVGWAFAIWGIGLYWWAGLLYAWQVRILMTTQARRTPRGERAARPADTPQPATRPDPAGRADRADRADA